MSKSFGGLQAVSNVDLDRVAGEVLAIVGENGAEKSTLIKILTGVYRPDSGEILVDGEQRAIPMRMSDDIGVSTAEAIRFDLEGCADELPLVFVGRITIGTGEMTNEAVNAMREEPFRCIGVALLEC